MLVGELVLSTALLLAAGGRGGARAAPLGVSLALLLHLGIALTPPPNNIGAFSVIMACRAAWANAGPTMSAALSPLGAFSVIMACRAAWANTGPIMSAAPSPLCATLLIN